MDELIIKNILILIKEIKEIAKNGILPDGDEANISTILWAQDKIDMLKENE